MRLALALLLLLQAPAARPSLSCEEIIGRYAIANAQLTQDNGELRAQVNALATELDKLKNPPKPAEKK